MVPHDLFHFSDPRLAKLGQTLLKAEAIDPLVCMGDLVKGLAILLKADTVFISQAIDFPTTRVRGITGFKKGAAMQQWDYSLQDNPCQLTYLGQPTFIPCDVALRFLGKKNSGYESYIGVPLFDGEKNVIGHLAVFSSKVIVPDDTAQLLLQMSAACATMGLRQIFQKTRLGAEIENLQSRLDITDEAVLTLTHDLRSPLSALVNYLSSVSSTTLPEDTANGLNKAKASAEQLLGLANDYLDFARLDSAAQQLDQAPVDIHQIALGAAEDAMILGASRNVKITVPKIPETLFVFADAVEIKRAFANLLSNAVSFSPEGDQVTISIEQQGDFVRVSINDNGSGLSEIRVDEIFEPFVTGDRNFKRPQTIGMGLAIAKSIIERNNGTIGVENQTVGVRFYFDLPATTADAA